MNWKHRTAALVAVPIVVVVLTATQSEAHDAAVKGSVVCQADGTAKVTWTVTNDYSLTTTLSAATRVSSQLNGHTLAKAGQSGDSLTATESLAASGQTLTLQVHAHWSDGFVKDDSAAVKLPGVCEQPKVKDATASVTVTPGTCTAAGSASYAVSHAALIGTFSSTPGAHSQAFKADTGHLFADGTSTKTLSYTVPGKDHSLCAVVSPVNPTVDASVCKRHYGGPTDPTVVLPADGDYTYTVAYDGSTVTVTATLVNADRNMGTPAGWTATSSTTETYTVQLHTAHCAVKPKRASLSAQTYNGCDRVHRWLVILARHGIQSVVKTHNADRTRFVLRAVTRHGYLMHSGKHGHGPLVHRVRWVFHAHDTGSCQPQTS